MNIKKGHISYVYKGEDRSESFDMDCNNVYDELTVLASMEKLSLGDRIKVRILPKDEIIMKYIYLDISLEFNSSDKIFLNGFQSWSESREFDVDEKIKNINPIIYSLLKNYGDYNIIRNPGKKGQYHGFTYTYVRKSVDTIDFWGSLDESKGYTIFKFDTSKNSMKIIKDCQGVTIEQTYDAFDILSAEGNVDDVFEEYYKIMNIKKTSAGICTGWTSWYNYYTNINEDIILNNLDEFEKRNIKIDIFQIDDGYEKAVGDWLETNQKFRKGMKKIAQAIKKSGYKAGLWLAPFICEKNSRIFKEHDDWILKYENGNKVKAGVNPLWSYDFYALDIYNEGVRSYLKQVFSNIFENWGFDMVKLDFLYAAGILPTKYKSRGEVMYDAVKFLRDIAGDKLILGCGVPLGAAFGLVDYCRIGSDINPKWEDSLLKALNSKERVSTQSSLESTISRHHMNGRAFYNDPDVFILRSSNNSLSKEQKRTLFILNIVFGGLVFTSDNIGEYSQEEMREYLSHLPHREKKINYVEKYHKLYKIGFNINDREYMLISNLSGNQVKTPLSKGIQSNQQGQLINFSNEGQIDVYSNSNESSITVSPYTTICFYKMKNTDFELLGGCGHVFPGSEVEKFIIDETNISMRLSNKAVLKQDLYIKVPDKFEAVNVNGKFIKTQRISDMNIVKYKWDMKE